MSERLQAALEHRYIYVPREYGTDTLELGKRLGLALARGHRVPLTVLSAQKPGAADHPELAHRNIVSERSGRLEDSGVVLAWCPRHKTMEKLHRLQKSVVVLVEWIPGEMEAWAKLNEAYNVVTGKVMDSGLSEEAIELMEAVVGEGYNGWTKKADVTITKGMLADLWKAGAYDRDLVLAYARREKREDSVQRLMNILDSFERTLPVGGPLRRMVL